MYQSDPIHSCTPTPPPTSNNTSGNLNANNISSPRWIDRAWQYASLTTARSNVGGRFGTYRSESSSCVVRYTADSLRRGWLYRILSHRDLIWWGFCYTVLELYCRHWQLYHDLTNQGGSIRPLVIFCHLDSWLPTMHWKAQIGPKRMLIQYLPSFN